MGGIRKNFICTVEGCQEKARAYGLCSAHYQRSYLHGRLSRHGEAEISSKIVHPPKLNDGRWKHPLYQPWHERRKRIGVTAEWEDFWQFVKDIGEKPGKNFALVRLRDEPYGPTNFEWREHLRRREGETKKQWNARKWQSRRAAFPEYETNRYMLRKYGITLDRYKEMLTEQGGVCAICKRPERSIEFKTGQTRNLAVDHCHATKKVRGLLCFDCNSAIGRLKESTALLDAAKAYLLTHG